MFDNACSHRIVVDVCNDASDAAALDRKRLGTAHEHRPDPVVRAVHGGGKRRVNTSDPRAQRSRASNRGDVDVVAHDRERETAPIRLGQRTREQFAIVPALVVGVDEPLAVDQPRDQVIRDSRFSAARLAGHASRIQRRTDNSRESACPRIGQQLVELVSDPFPLPRWSGRRSWESCWSTGSATVASSMHPPRVRARAIAHLMDGTTSPWTQSYVTNPPWCLYPSKLGTAKSRVGRCICEHQRESFAEGSSTSNRPYR